ncbi:glycosyltransferase [Aeromonas sp. 31P]
MKKYNITATVVAQNEETWIEASILSIIHLVDEIIIVDDASDDKTLEIAKQLAERHSHIKVFSFPAKHTIENYGELKNFAIAQSKNEWILRWDADFIAYDHIDNNISMMLERTVSNDADAYLMKGPNLFGTSEHFLLGKETFGYEFYLFKKDAVKIYCDGIYSDRFKLNDGFKSEIYPKAAFLHMNLLKPLKKQLFRSRMVEFHVDKDKPKGIDSYWKWVHFKKTGEIIKDDSGIVKSSISYLKTRTFKLESFDFEKWGPHPNILSNYKCQIDKFKIDPKAELNEYFLIHPEE